MSCSAGEPVAHEGETGTFTSNYHGVVSSFDALELKEDLLVCGGGMVCGVVPRRALGVTVGPVAQLRGLIWARMACFIMHDKRSMCSAAFMVRACEHVVKLPVRGLAGQGREAQGVQTRCGADVCVGRVLDGCV